MVVFETWRDYVVNKKIRERRDAEKQYEREIKQFATAMQSVKIAQHHVSMWKRCVDIYTDQVIQLTSRDLTHLSLHLHETSTSPPYNSPFFNMHFIFSSTLHSLLYFSIYPLFHRFFGNMTKPKKPLWSNQASTTISLHVFLSPRYPPNYPLGKTIHRWKKRRMMNWLFWREEGSCLIVWKHHRLVTHTTPC